MAQRKASKKSAKESAKESAKGKKQDGKKSCSTQSATPLRSLLQLAQLRSEKCDLKESEATFALAAQLAREKGDLRSLMEAVAGLLRLSGETLDEGRITQWEGELNHLMQDHPKEVPPQVWYCKGALARHRNEPRAAQRFFHRYLRLVRHGNEFEPIAKGWLMLAISLSQRNHLRRATWLAEETLRRYEAMNLPGINGMLYLLLGSICERQGQLDSAMNWYRKAHVSFLGEHNWYYHLYVLYGYARVSRLQRNFAQAYWYLDMIEAATARPEFGLLRREVIAERSLLRQESVDLLIDSRKGVVTTREGGSISLRKQFLLLNILEALSEAHSRTGMDKERGLSKAEIIRQVWSENYRPESHDNKLYYNINRLRKLIEPDVKKPQYVLSWKEGYRLAPGLRIQLVQGGKGLQALSGLESQEGEL